MVQKIVFSFALMSDTKLDTCAERVAIKMANNPYFISIAPQVTDFVVLAGDFRSKLAGAASRDAQKVASKNASKKEVIAQLKQLAFYVQAIAAGLPEEEAVQCILSSGFEVRKAQGAAEIPSVPANIKVTSGKISGTLNISFSRSDFATHYNLRYCEQGTEWNEPIEVKTKHSITGLTPAVYYEFQVRAIGSKGTGNWSQTITKLCTDGE